MLLYQRQMRVTGGPAAAAWAVEVTAAVNQHATSEVSLWMGRYGMPPTTLGWSAMLESLGQVDDLNAAMAGDAELTALVAKGGDFVADAEDDRLLAIIGGEITERTAVGGYVGAARAVAAPGKWNGAGEWATHIAGVYSEVTGLAAVVASTVSGPMGEFTWLVQHADSSSIEAAIGASMGSDKYRAEVEGGGEFFLPGASQIYAQRVA